MVPGIRTAVGRSLSGKGIARCEIPAGQSGMGRSVPVGSKHRIVHRVLIDVDFLEAVGVDGIDVFPYEFAVFGDFQQMPFRHGADQGIAVGQTLTTRTDVAEEALMALGAVLPHDLIGDLSLLFVRILVFWLPLCVTRLRGVDVVTRVLPCGVQEGVDFHGIGLAGTIVKILAVVEDQEVTRSRQPLVDPMDVMGPADLLMAHRTLGPVLKDEGRITLLIPGGIAETV